MFHHFSQDLIFLFILSILSVVSSFVVLMSIYKSSKNFLSFFYLKAGKSHTNASLLGGISLSVSAILAVTCLLYYGNDKFNAIEMLILKCSFFPILITTLYGYLDDKFEIRARHKLSLQIIAVASFTIPLSSDLYQGHWEALALAFVFCLAYINGSNLIDGLDTLFAKIGTITSLAFLLLAFHTGSVPAMAFSVMICASLGTFYFFNKEPAKIYAGEIGGSVLGMLLFIQASLLFANMSTPSFEAASAMFYKILIVSIYPLSELGITFSRRIFYRQSPFRGDQLHIHHIIKSKFNLTPTKASNAISSILVITVSIGLIMTFALEPKMAFLSTVISLSWIYSSACYRHWSKSYSKESKKEIFLNLNEKMIHVIDGKAIDLLYSKYQPSSLSGYSRDEDNVA